MQKLTRVPVSDPTMTMAAELQHAFDFLNERLFLGTLPNCLITLQREKGTYGYLHRSRYVRRDGRDFAHELAINPSYFAACSLRFTLSVLGHEACHLWQLVSGQPGKRGNRGYHNAEWSARMESIGLMPSDTGEPGGRRVGERMSHYIIKGGQFEKVADELIDEHHFAISWIDRHPMAVPRGMSLPTDYKPPTDADVEAKILGLRGAPIEVRPDIAAESSRPPTRFSELLDQPDVRELPEPAFRGAASTFVWPSDASKASTRTKYRCPGCSTRVWGGKDLDIRCGKCGGRAFEVESDSRGYGARR